MPQFTFLSIQIRAPLRKGVGVVLMHLKAFEVNLFANKIKTYPIVTTIRAINYCVQFMRYYQCNSEPRYKNW